MDKELYYSTSMNEKELLAFLEISGCLDYVYKECQGKRVPIVLSDAIDLMWIAEYVYTDDKPDYLIVMGPFFCAESSMKNIEEAIRKMNFPISLRKQMLKILTEIPTITMSMIDQYNLMLHYTIYEESISLDDVHHQDTKVVVLEDEYEQEIKVTSDAEKQLIREEMILKAVREGNRSFDENAGLSFDSGGELVSNTGNPLRDAKNTVIIFTALCRRAATQAGVSAKVAKHTERETISKVEECDTITQLVHINLQMLSKFIEQVNYLKQNPNLSKEIQECCIFIKNNLLRPITLEDIAENSGYTEYYLTKKFYKEMGIRLVDYLKNARIEYAKLYLLTTNKGIQEISDSLHFGTRNYFSKIFREQVGMSPAEYRKSSIKESR